MANHRFATVLLFAILFCSHAWFTIGPNLCMLNVNHFDAWSQLPWMHRWADPELFPNDLMADYFQQYHLPPGLRATYFVLLQWCGIDLNIACRIVAIAWYTLTFSLFLAVVRLAVPGRPWTTTLAAAAVTMIPFHFSAMTPFSPFSRFDGGLARSASAAVLLATIYGIAGPSRLLATLAIVIGAAFYPPAFVIAVAALCLAPVFSESLQRALVEFAWLVPGALLAAAIVWLWYPLDLDPGFGTLVSKEDITWAPEIARVHFPHGPSMIAVATGWVKACWPAMAALALQAASYRGGRLLRANAIMLLAGLATTILAYFVWPRLYEIDRYEQLPRNVVLFVAIAAVIARMPLWNRKWLAWVAVLAYVAFNVALVEYRKLRAKPSQSEWASTGRYGRKVIDFLIESPKDTLTATLGDELDGVPTFAKRSLLLQPSALWPYHRNFHGAVVDRYLATQEATYATEVNPLKRLRDDFTVRYLSVNRARFDPAKFEALAGHFVTRAWLPERVEPIVNLGPNRDFILRNPPRDWVVIEDGDYLLIDLNRVR